MSKTTKTTPTTAQGAKPATKKNPATMKKPLRQLFGWMQLGVFLHDNPDGSACLELALPDSDGTLSRLPDGVDAMELFSQLAEWGDGSVEIEKGDWNAVRAWMFDECVKVYRGRKRAYRDDED